MALFPFWESLEEPSSFSIGLLEPWLALQGQTTLLERPHGEAVRKRGVQLSPAACHSLKDTKYVNENVRPSRPENPWLDTAERQPPPNHQIQSQRDHVARLAGPQNRELS